MKTAILYSTANNRSTPGVALKAWAKINLSLIVLGKRADGFHDLHSVMAAIDLHDDLHLDHADKPGVFLTCTGRHIDASQDNLVVRAAGLLAQAADIEPQLKIRLHKRIPIGAGLGGGSSDAAACLLGLNHFWNLNLPVADLATIAAKLGSDVAFFLCRSMALCTGRGEIVRPLSHRCHKKVLLIIPHFSLSTREVYSHYRPNLENNHKLVQLVLELLERGDIDGLLNRGINTLTDTCVACCPPLKQLRQQIDALGIRPLFISGSGSCMYVTADSDDQLAAASAAIRQNNLADAQIVQFIQPIDPFAEAHHANL